MSNLSPLFTTGKDNWATPIEIVQPWIDKHKLTIDAAADITNHKLPRWYGQGGERADALAEPWDANERYWCNPPYSLGAQRKFVDRAVEVGREGGIAVCLLPARTDTKLFHECIWNKRLMHPYWWVKELHFLQGRIKFIDPTGDPLRKGNNNSAPFPSMIVVFGEPYPHL